MSLTATKGKRAPHKVCVLEAPANDAAPALSLDQARCDIANATTLDDLKAVWTRKSMAPHRAELQGDLDARKAELANAPNAEEGKPDTDRGEGFTDEEPKVDEEAPF